MAKKKLSDDKIRRCVFLQPYRKSGPWVLCTVKRSTCVRCARFLNRR